LKTPDQLDDARAFVEKHAEGGPLNGNTTRRLLISPIKGVFQLPPDNPTGTSLVPGAVVGSVKGVGDDVPVSAPRGGTIAEWLVGDGEPVSPGQPLVRLQPAGDS